MDISQSSQHFAIAIAPKPEGGFASTSDNPTFIVEGASEEEVREKVIQKIGELAGPQLAALFRDNWKPGAQLLPGAQSPTQEKVNITFNKKISFAFKKNEDSEPKQVTLEAGPSAERGFSPLAKVAIAIGVFLLLFWLMTHR